MKSKSIDLTTLTEDQKLNILLGSPEYAMIPKRWLELYNQIHKISYHYKNDSVCNDGAQVEFDVYMAILRNTAKVKGVSKHLSKQVLDDTVRIWMSEERASFLKDLREKMSFSMPAIDPIQQWVQAATGKTDKLDLAVVRHFVWQVRRKVYGHKIDHHMMPILFGKTGGGKSEAVRHMLEPLNDVVFSSDLSIFSDQFKTRFFTRFYIMFFDEMAKSDRADVDKLKNILTSETVDFRIMHSEKNQNGPQNCTFIGCSNDTVHDKIYDPTSARRYWQINCADKLNWGLINQIDYKAFWTCIDEKLPSPIIPFLKDIGQVQDKEIRHKDMIEDWAERFLTPFVANDRSDPVSTTELYELFMQYCVWQKINSPPTFQKFSRRIPTIFQTHWKLLPTRTTRGTVWRLSCRYKAKGANLEEMEMISAEIVGDEEALKEIQQKHQQKADVIAARFRQNQEREISALRRKNKWQARPPTKEKQEQIDKDRDVLEKDKEDRANRLKK